MFHCETSHTMVDLSEVSPHNAQRDRRSSLHTHIERVVVATAGGRIMHTLRLIDESNLLLKEKMESAKIRCWNKTHKKKRNGNWH